MMLENSFRRWYYLPYACDSSDLGKLKIKQHMFLIINNINSSPVHCYYHVILWQTGAWKLVSFIKSREQQWPLITSVVDNIFFDALRINLLSRVVSLLNGTHTISNTSTLVHEWNSQPLSNVFTYSLTSISLYALHALFFSLQVSAISLYVFTRPPISLHEFTLPQSLSTNSYFPQHPFLYPYFTQLSFERRVCTLYRRRTLNEMFCSLG